MRPLRGKARVLVTGAAGGIGRAFRAWAADRYDFVCLDREPTPGVRDAHVADLTDGEAVRRAAQGCTHLLHLGANPREADFRTIIAPNNIAGTYHAFEAARDAGIGRIVFASTVQVDNGYGPGEPVSVAMPPKPRNTYAVSKLFGEHLGRMYAERHKMSVICLRFGTVLVPSRIALHRRNGRAPHVLSVSERDACEIIGRSLDAPERIRFAVLPAFSRNAASLRDLTPLKDVLGFEPADDVVRDWETDSRDSG